MSRAVTPEQMSGMYEAVNSVDTNRSRGSLLFRYGAGGGAMYWWQWTFQIIGGWFCLAVVAAALWAAFVHLGRRPKVKRPAARPAISARR